MCASDRILSFTAKAWYTPGELLLNLWNSKVEMLFCAFGTDTEWPNVITGDDNGRTILWDSFTAKRLATYKGHTKKVWRF